MRYVTFALLTPMVLAPMLLSHSASAQACDTVESRTALAAFSGHAIRSLRIVPLAPAPLPAPANAIDGLHVVTRKGTVRRQLLFAVGDTLDTLGVAESLRRLRRLRYLTDVAVQGVRCGERREVDLTVTTRDAWSAKPSIRVRSNASTSIGLTERNLFGTGREATVAVRSDRGRVGVGSAVRDPWFLGDRLSLDVGMNRYADGSESYVALGKREQSVFDRRGFSANASRSNRKPTAGIGDAFLRTRANVLTSRRLNVTEGAVTALVAGAEYEQTGLIAAMDAAIVGPSRVRREFLGADLGITRRSSAFDTLTWLLPHSAIVDVPLAFEVDALVGAGHDRVTGKPAGRVDLWAGKMWIPSRRALLVADVWGSGYRSGARSQAATVRSSLAYYRAANRGLWTARIAGEQFFDPDPDVRALATADPTMETLPRRARLAEAAIGATLERDWRLRGLTRSWALDGALFNAFSMRWDPAGGSSEQLYSGIVGIGFRLAPTKLGRATARLDFGYPVVRSREVSNRPFIAISVSPWLEQGRQRDGREVR